MKKLVLGAALALAMSGCTTRLVDFTIISSKNIDLSRGAEFKRSKERVNGEDMAHIIIIIPTGMPNAKEAMDRAIESVPGAVALLDGVITQEFFWFPYIYGYSKFIVEGTPLIDPKLLANHVQDDIYRMVTLNKDGSVKAVKALSKHEFEALAKG